MAGLCLKCLGHVEIIERKKSCANVQLNEELYYYFSKPQHERQPEQKFRGKCANPPFVWQDQMQLAKDTQVLAEGQDKLTNLRTPGVAKEELLAEQVRDQKRIALDQELLVQSQKRLAEDMDNAIDGKLRWERLEDYRSFALKKWSTFMSCARSKKHGKTREEPLPGETRVVKVL